MLSVTAIAVEDSKPTLFIQSHSLPDESTLVQELPAWVWMCDNAPVDVFLQLSCDRVLHCPISQLLLLANE
ncbi:MAG: hypothetical protein ACP5RH_19520 [Leptodesmis sp.]|jgi:hypothetical protein|uniref:hypothetical protein n=1 Tax=Leptodesmis TaxID=2664261 RepID=UPI001F320D39|nr:hypothetical protein [Leptodesmis sichuanensis]UIE39468.1 hypothetical protein KIK02_07875 [Leptodesmis sichuanensis A121]